jgi:hypothetical protein
MNRIRSMVTEFINGQMVENMKVIGTMGNSMVKENIFYQMAKLK